METTEEMGQRARMIFFAREISMAALFKITLGLEGMNKISQATNDCGQSFRITNDGATILNVDISKTQDDEVGDDVTTLDYRMVVECARKASLAKVMDNEQDEEKFKEDLIKIAMITLSPYEFVSEDKEHFAKLVVGAVMRLKGSTNLGSIQITKKPGGSLRDSFLQEGFVLDKRIENALVTGCEIESTFDNPESVKRREEFLVSMDKLMHFSGVANGQPCTIVLRGARPYMLNEAERCMHNVLRALSSIANDIRVLFGGVWPELMSKAVDELARKTPGIRGRNC